MINNHSVFIIYRMQHVYVIQDTVCLCLTVYHTRNIQGINIIIFDCVNEEIINLCCLNKLYTDMTEKNIHLQKVFILINIQYIEQNQKLMSTNLITNIWLTFPLLILMLGLFQASPLSLAEYHLEEFLAMLPQQSDK